MITRIVFAILLVQFYLPAQGFTGNAGWSKVTVAELPAAAAGNKGVHYTVIDGASATDCGTGGGSTQVDCVSNGSIWQAIGTGGGGGSGYNLIDNNGTPITQRTTINIIPGTGMNTSCVDNAGATRSDCTFSSNLAVNQSIAADQNGGAIFCASTGSATALTCDPGTNVGSASWTLATFANPGPRILISSDTQTSGTPTVTVSSLGPYNLKKADCSTAIGGDLLANAAMWFWFNGTNFCEVLAAGPQKIASGTATLGTSSISSASCATVVTVSASGVASTDVISWTPNASIKAVIGYAPSTSGGLSIAAYPTTNNVNFDVCNWSASPITPGSVVLNFNVLR